MLLMQQLIGDLRRQMRPQARGPLVICRQIKPRINRINCIRIPPPAACEHWAQRSALQRRQMHHRIQVPVHWYASTCINSTCIKALLRRYSGGT